MSLESGRSPGFWQRWSIEQATGLAPSMDPHARMTEPPISGDPPNPIDPPSGCRFRTRCAFVMPRCAEAIPPPVAVSDAHHVACYLFDGEPAPIAA